MAAEYERVAIQALRRNPHDPEAWTRWGLGLFEEAFTVSPDIAATLFAEAARKFTVAKDIRPHEPQYWLNIAAATQNQAVYGPRNESIPLLTEAGKYYDKVVRLNPRIHQAWHSWARSLFVLGSRHEDRNTACQHLYQADIRFTVAHDLEPKNAETLYCPH